MNKKGLGKGLGALISSTNKNSAELKNEFEKVLEIDISKIKTNLSQPRKTFDEEKIEELAQSIKENGLIQPIILRMKNNNYEIIAGERRFRAFKKLNREKIQAIIKEYDDIKMSKVALIENIQREDLNPVEEANGLRALINEYNISKTELAKILGKSRPYISNSLRVLDLSDEILSLIENNKISMGHARALLAIEDVELRMKLANEIIFKNLSVRELEKVIKNINNSKKGVTDIVKENISNVELSRVQDNLRNIFSTKVNIKGNEKKGKIEIEYYNLDDLNRIIDVISE